MTESTAFTTEVERHLRSYLREYHRSRVILRKQEFDAGHHCRATADEPECCCNCKYLAADYSHPLTDGGRLAHQRGWVCLAPEFAGVLSGWTEHGLCEMHEYKGEVA